MDPGVERFEDERLGPQTQDPSAQDGDLLVRDRDGNWTYQFAVTVDDWRQDIDLVIGGVDLLPSTGRQLRLARLLGRERLPRVPPPPRADPETRRPETEQVGPRYRRPGSARARVDAAPGDRGRDERAL